MDGDLPEGRRPEGQQAGLERLTEALRHQRVRGLLGPDSIEAQVAHSRGFATALPPGDPGRVIDLGSGGGLPGLVLAVLCWPTAEVVLVDASQRRCTYLELVVAELDLAPRVEVRWARAEELGREAAWRGGADVMVARSFGPPAVVAECAAPLLRVGGHLVVSEPPGGHERWPREGLDPLGLEWVATDPIGDAHYARLRLARACPDDFPRRPGLPTRRPLF